MGFSHRANFGECNRMLLTDNHRSEAIRNWDMLLGSFCVLAADDNRSPGNGE